MPEKHDFDFRKPEDQERFDQLPEAEKDVIVGEAQDEADTENKIREFDEMMRKYKEGEAAKEASYVRTETGLIDDVNQILPLKDPLGVTTISTRFPSEGKVLSKWSEENGRAAESGIIDTPFAMFTLSYFKNHPEEVAKIKHYFADKVILDIGAGARRDGFNIARQLGCKAYVAIEPFYAESLAHQLLKDHDSADDPKGSDFDETVTLRAVVSTDALTFLRNVPDHSVCIMTFGTDGLMIEDKDYIQKVGEEITRCLQRDGAFISGNSVLLPLSDNPDPQLKYELIGDGGQITLIEHY